MAAIPTILKGDDSGAITITLDTSHTYTGATLAFAYQGITRTFTDLTAGGSVSVTFTHDETAGMTLGTYPIYMELIGSTGGRETVANAEMRIKVTDCIAEVNAGGSFTVAPGSAFVPQTDVEDLASRYTMAQLAEKVNQIVHVLAQRSLLAFGVVAMLVGSAGAEVQTARLDALYNDSLVVTNVTGGGSGGVDASTVTNIASSAAVTNAGAVAVAADYAGGKRDLTNNVCAAESYTAWSATPPSGYTFGDAQPVFHGDTERWTWYVEGPSVAVDAESGASTADATSATFTFDDSGTKTFTATRSKAAYSNDTFATYGFVTNAVAVATNGLVFTETDPTATAKANAAIVAAGCVVTNEYGYATATTWDTPTGSFMGSSFNSIPYSQWNVAYLPWDPQYGLSGYEDLSIAFLDDIPAEVTSNTVANWGFATTNMTGGTAAGINLHDSVLACDWQLSVTNGVFTWTVKED